MIGRDIKPLLLTSRGIQTKIGETLIKNKIRPGSADRLLIITVDDYGVNDYLVQAAKRIGFEEENIVVCGNAKKGEQITASGERFDYIYVGEGNTFEILNMLNQAEMLPNIRNQIEKGSRFIGTSAGAMLAGQDIEFAKDFDKNFSGVKNLKGLNLFPGSVLPHRDEDEFIRHCYNTDSESLLRYQELYYVSNDQLLVWDVDKTVLIFIAYYEDITDKEKLLFFMNVMKNRNVKAKICTNSNEEIKAFHMKEVINDEGGAIHFQNNEETFILDLTDLNHILKIYRFQDEVFGLRLTFEGDSEKHIDIMIGAIECENLSENAWEMEAIDEEKTNT